MSADIFPLPYLSLWQVKGHPYLIVNDKKEQDSKYSTCNTQLYLHQIAQQQSLWLVTDEISVARIQLSTASSGTNVN
jgi:hypothetical protein